MEFCRKCRSAMSIEAKFCRECGAPKSHDNDTHSEVSEEIRKIESEGLKSEQAPRQSAVTEPQPVKRKGRLRSRLSIVLLTAAVLLSGLLYGGYRFGTYWLSADRLVSQFVEALEEKDGRKLAELLHSEEEKLLLTEETMGSMVKYVEQDSEVIRDIRKQLEKQAFALQSSGKAEGAEGLVRLEKNGKRFYLMDQYRLSLLPVYLTLSTNYRDVSIKVDGKEVAVADTRDYEETFGPFVPGIHELEAILKTDYIQLERKEQVAVVDADKDFTTSLDLDGEDVNVRTGFGSKSGLTGTLWVNGKDTGIDPFKTPLYGPVTLDGAVKLAVEAQFPWGAMRSDEIPVTSSTVDVGLRKVSDEALKDKVTALLVEHLREEVEAVTSGDTGKLKHATDQIKANVQRQIDSERDQSFEYKISFMGASFDMDTFELVKADGAWELHVLCIAEYMTDYNYGSGWRGMGEDKVGKDFELLYDPASGNWKVNSDYSFYDGVDFSGFIKEVKESDPITFTRTPSTAGIPAQ